MSNQAPIEKIEILKEAEAAKYIGMSRSFLRQDRMNGHRQRRTKGPVFIRIGRTIRYHIFDLDNWLEINRVKQADNHTLFSSVKNNRHLSL